MDDFQFQVYTTLEADEVVRQIANDSNDEIVKFILAIEERVADFDFTVKLYAAIGDIIRTEIEADPEGWME